MASLFKHPESQYWFACFTTVEGKRTKRTTRATTRKEAQKIADQFEEAAQKKRTSLNTRKVIQELHASITGEDLVFPSVRAHFEQWVGDKENEVAEATFVFYNGVVKKALNWLGKRADDDLVTITERDIKAFREHEFANLSAKTVNHELKTLKMIFRDALRRKLITDDPALAVKTLKNDTAKRRLTFTDEQIKHVLSVADDEWKSMVMLGLYTGQRLIDIALLKTSNVSLQAGVIKLTARKTGKEMTIPMAPALHRHVNSLNLNPEKDEPLHPRAFKIVVTQGKSSLLSNQFAAILARAGLREKKSHRRTGVGRGVTRDASGLSFHSFRHTAVTRLKEAGVPQAVVMQLVGHDSVEMSNLYTHVGTTALKNAADAMPDVTKP